MVEWNATFIHVVFNYISVVGVPLVLFFLIAGYFMRSKSLKQASLVGFAGLGLITLFITTAGVMAQSEVVVADEPLSTHRVAGYLSAFLMVILGVWSIMGAINMNNPQKTTPAQLKLYPGVSLVLGLVTTGVLFWTVISGTVIGHPEVVKSESIEQIPAIDQQVEGEAAITAPEEVGPTSEEPIDREPAAEDREQEPFTPELQLEPSSPQNEGDQLFEADPAESGVESY